jgi:hypothetical protein
MGSWLSHTVRQGAGLPNWKVAVEWGAHWTGGRTVRVCCGLATHGHGGVGGSFDSAYSQLYTELAMLGINSGAAAEGESGADPVPNSCGLRLVQLSSASQGAYDDRFVSWLALTHRKGSCNLSWCNSTYFTQNEGPSC